MKKGLKWLLCACMILMAGCSSAKPAPENVDDVMDGIYEGFKEDELPMMLELFPIDEENEEWFLGTNEIDYKEALACESGVGSVPHSVVVIEAKKAEDVETIKNQLRDSMNGHKWVCVGVQDKDIVIESQGNYIVMILDGFDLAPALLDNFNDLF